MTPIRILVDPEIPGAVAAFRDFGEVRPFDAATLTAEPRVAADADVLVFRTATRIDARFLAAAPALRALVTPVVGLDHVDSAAVRAHAIRRGRPLPVLNAPGSTADGVADWVLAALAEGGAFRGLPNAVPLVGIVGLGHCGHALARRLDLLGIPWRACDPPREAAQDAGGWVPFAALAECDAVTLHVPLTGPGESPWPTRDLVDRTRLAFLGAGRTRYLVNASRGAVISEAAIIDFEGPASRPALLLDVFQGEPAPDPAVVRAARIATPHVAGSVFEGRHRALAAVRARLAAVLDIDVPPFPGPDAPATLELPRPLAGADLEALMGSTGIRGLARAFRDDYAAAAPDRRPEVFRRHREGAMRHEIGWPLPPDGPRNPPGPRPPSGAV